MGKTRKTNLSNVIYKKLRRAIASSELGPGVKIIESDMIKKFGVSRTPFREAIKRLESELKQRYGSLSTSVEVPNQVYIAVISQG